MKSSIKLIVLFLIFSIISCAFFEKREYCPDDSKNLGNNLKFGTYRGKQSDVVIDDDTGKEFIIPAKETLILNEDSTFTYFAIANEYNNDTIKKVLNANFKIYQDPGFPWYVLELKSDFIYEKIKTGASFSTDFIESKRSINFAYDSESNLLSDVDNELDCFSLAYKVNPYKCNWCDPDWEYCCDKMILQKNKTFCLEK